MFVYCFNHSKKEEKTEKRKKRKNEKKKEKRKKKEMTTKESFSSNAFSQVKIVIFSVDFVAHSPVIFIMHKNRNDALNNIKIHIELQLEY